MRAPTGIKGAIESYSLRRSNFICRNWCAKIVSLWGSELKTWSFSSIIASFFYIFLFLTRPRMRSQTTGFLFARQRTLNKTGVTFLLHIRTNSCALYSTCMYDKFATSACVFYLQRAINFISECGGIEPCFKSRGPVKRRYDFLKIFSLLTRVIANWKSAFSRSISFVWLCPESKQLQPHL